MNIMRRVEEVMTANNEHNA